jgi:Dyp-type peroxidase family
MTTLDLHDIQGIIVYGYGKLAAACYVLLQVTDVELAKVWLRQVADTITTAEKNPSDIVQETCLNIAFTHHGLKALGLTESTLAQFSNEFQDGMTVPEHRQRILGDHGSSAPEYWEWGGPTTPNIHILFMLYGKDEDTLDRFYNAQFQAFETSGIQYISTLNTYRLPKRREHFGFRDDVADPVIAGSGREESPGNTINAGEFILGYPNGYGQYTNRPLIQPEQDSSGFLPADPTDSNRKDLGRNGSYLVFRQLHQNVRLFWESLDTLTRMTDGSSNPGDRLKLAAKMVGRWPSGTPLVESPELDNPELAEKNEFLYHAADPQGFKCPFGAHIRRVNPRDALEPNPGSQEALATTNRHRILRRGRTYGEPLAASMEPDQMLQADDRDSERGIHFICFNANISRQFEFIQHTWINNPKFDGLYSDDDPLMGDRALHDQMGGSGTFTIQATPVRKCIDGLARFVEVRGGAYFFMPGVNAVRFLASLSKDSNHD